MSFDIPDKRYFKIGEVSKFAGVAPYVIRYWESEFEQIRPKRAKSNQRLYRYEDVELILRVKTLLHGKGYTIAGARKYLAGETRDDELTQTKIVEAHRKLEAIKQELHRLHQQLEQKK